MLEDRGVIMHYVEIQIYLKKGCVLTKNSFWKTLNTDSSIYCLRNNDLLQERLEVA